MNKEIRTRFAPSPTGIMHIGNIRTALLNLLFTRQKSGTFVLRIEDTDPARMFDPGAKKIISDLKWLSLNFDEGPDIGGPYAPYFQSERMPIYNEKLKELQKLGGTYRCFCSEEELEKKRTRQIAMKKPPRYEKTCLHLSQKEIDQNLADGKSFIWRMNLDPSKSVTIKDLAKGMVKFELENFTDFPLTRKDGTFTFMFANFVDDMTMKISHVFRGEDHLSNTAGQAALFEAFNVPLPTFWHMPMICNTEGKKLSKRDFGFSLDDLKNTGFLPEAINNYLAIIGGSFVEEIMSQEDLIKTLNFEHVGSTNRVSYDVEKLKWINHKWIDRYPKEKLEKLCRPFLEKQYPAAKQISEERLSGIIQLIKSDLVVLSDIVKVLSFLFEKPTNINVKIAEQISEENLRTIKEIVNSNLNLLSAPHEFIEKLKITAKEKNIGLKNLFIFLRIALTGEPKGPGIAELVEILGETEAKSRIQS